MAVEGLGSSIAFFFPARVIVARPYGLPILSWEWAGAIELIFSHYTER